MHNKDSSSVRKSGHEDDTTIHGVPLHAAIIIFIILFVFFLKDKYSSGNQNLGR